MEPEAMMRPEGPTHLGRYALHEVLGVGGMATVHRGELHAIGGFRRTVAVKVLHPHLRRDAKVVAGFLREARLAARLQHAHVVPVLDVGEAPEGVFLVMEHIDGVTLAALLAHLAAPERVAVGLRALTEALAGLHDAHELRDDAGRPLGLVHRDFTVNNVLVDRRGVARLADFGIARTERGPLVTTRPIVKGTLPYLAPEQVRGADLDRRTDVFAAGAVAFEILTGQPLQDAEGDPAVTLSRIVAGEHESTRALVPELPDALHDAVEWALRVDPAERCPDADALRRALLDAAEPRLATRDEVAATVERAAADAEAKAAPPRSSVSGTQASRLASGEAPPTISRLTRSRWPWALAALAALGLVVLSVRGVGAPAEPGPAAAPESSTAASPPAPAPHVDLFVRANGPLSALDVDGAPHPIPAGATEISVRVPPDARWVVARSVDGREARAAIEGTLLELRFPHPRAPAPVVEEAPAATSRRPSPRRARSSSSSSELAGNPYAN